MPKDKLVKNPKVWGPKMWFMIHTIAKTYPCNPSNEKKVATRDFFESLEHVLPCKMCRTNYRDYIRAHPPALSSKRSLTRWTWNLHDSVNQRLGKKSIPYDDVYC